MFTCKRCHRAQIYTSRHWKKPNQPNWYYQLDEVMYQGIVSDMHVPLLALDALRKGSKDDFGFTHELIYSSQSTADGVIESDLNCVADGILTIGEAKSGDRLAQTAAKEKKILSAYSRLAQRLNARQIVFATSQLCWRPETERLIKAEFASAALAPKLLAYGDLT